jgi:hypothetical protein
MLKIERFALAVIETLSAKMKTFTVLLLMERNYSFRRPSRLESKSFRLNRTCLNAMKGKVWVCGFLNPSFLVGYWGLFLHP